MREQQRTEHDFLGEMSLPADVLYGIQTARALDNFPITGVQLGHFPELVIALAMAKKACALANGDLGVLDRERTGAIVAACDEIMAGRHHESFVVDMIQGGAGTSTNMNANEVIANLALRLLGHSCGDYRHLHPNDHVNLSQSTNDVYPTAMRLAVLSQCAPLIHAQGRLRSAFENKAQEFATILKVGRTQLQDAVPMTLGMEFAGFAATVEEDIERVGQLSELLKEVNLGGTAIGTGINAPSGYAEIAVSRLSEISGFRLIAAKNLVEATSDVGAFVTFSGVLKRIAVKLSKICNDLRLLSSGPRAGFGEIRLPAVQPGSSIMPGKVNPVIPEVVNQVAFQVIGNDLTVTFAAEAGQLQLNAMEPVMLFNVLQSLRMLTRSITVLTERCVEGIEVNVQRCNALVDNSLVLTTALVPLLGYEEAARIARLAISSGGTVGATVQRLGVMTQEEFEKVKLGAWTFGSPALAEG
ncbi:aspartate ammonia-lyase [Mesorhizobium sp. ORS 3428]|uniref:aspartate ammonia-lyase n=1 Tax=Mesorhizobium sp. ORS 3428 TaxID=540997 RepID=UPI0008DA19EA|nr:aspartate ammonia-lyase [Mesorhizobium sp. ORS 3428]OHV87638.1 aspartate ammonia-lyase [Mesorhizobium sp. ORS 3428]